MQYCPNNYKDILNKEMEVGRKILREILEKSIEIGTIIE